MQSQNVVYYLVLNFHGSPSTAFEWPNGNAVSTGNASLASGAGEEKKLRGAWSMFLTERGDIS